MLAFVAVIGGALYGAGGNGLSAWVAAVEACKVSSRGRRDHRCATAIHLVGHQGRAVTAPKSVEQCNRPLLLLGRVGVQQQVEHVGAITAAATAPALGCSHFAQHALIFCALALQLQLPLLLLLQ